MRVSFALVAAAAAIATTTPASAFAPVPPAPGFKNCPQRISSGFWTDLSVKRVGCQTGTEIAKAWVRRAGSSFPARITVRRYSCRLQTVQGETNPYGRVTCSRGRMHVRFYGFS